MATGRHVFAGEDDEWETIAASSDKRPQFLLPWPILANLPVAGPHAKMYAQPFGKSTLTKYYCIIVNLMLEAWKVPNTYLIVLYLKTASDG